MIFISLEYEDIIIAETVPFGTSSSIFVIEIGFDFPESKISERRKTAVEN